MLTTEDLVDLSETLRRAGFQISSQQLLATRRVLAGVQQGPDDQLTYRRLLTFLAPIFCTNPEEQQRFSKLFDEWIERFGPSPPDGPPPPPTCSTLETTRSHRWRTVALTLLIICGSGVGWVLWQELRPCELQGRIVAGGTPVAGAGVALGERQTYTDKEGRFTLSCATHDLPGTLAISADDFPPQTKKIGEEFAASYWPLRLPPQTRKLLLSLGDIELQSRASPPPLEGAINPPAETTSAAPHLEPVVRINARDVIPLPPWWQRLAWHQLVLALLPLLCWSTWQLFQRWRRPVLQRLASQTPPLLHEVYLQEGMATFFPTLALRRLTQSLRSRRFMKLSVLDVPKTVETTVRHGRLFQPVFGSYVEPEYIALIDRKTIPDHQARLALHLVMDLVKSDVLIEQYEFDGDPTLLRQVEGLRARGRGHGAELVSASALHVISLEDIQARTPAHRMFLFCAPSLLFDDLTALPHTWVAQLAMWEERFLFTPEPPERWGRVEWVLEKLGFSLLPLSISGFAMLTRALQSGTPLPARRSASHATEQPLHKRTVGRWIERRPPATEVVHRLCDDLEHTLGKPGFLWLSACAIYPEIHWGLTLRFGAELFQDSSDMEHLLPLLAPLVWFREAFMPDWLRIAVLQRLTPPEAKRVRQVLMNILSSVSSTDNQSFVLRVATDPPPVQRQLSTWVRLYGWMVQKWGLRQRVAAVVREAPQDNPLRDYVFVRFLSGKRFKTLAPVAPHAWLRALFPRGHAWLGTRAWVSLALSLMLTIELSAIFLRTVVSDPQLLRFTAVALSADGRYAVSGQRDNIVRTWEISLGKEAARLPRAGRISLLSISGDGGYVVSGSEDKTVRVWATSTGQKVAQMPHDAPVVAVAMSSDGGYVVSSSEDKTVRVWATSTGQEVAQMSHDAPVVAVAMSSDGGYVVSGSEDKTVRVWATSTGQEVAQMPHDAPLRAVALSSDGTTVVSASQESVQSHLFRVATSPPAAGNRPPVARLIAPAQAQVGEAVALDASGSSDPDGDPLSYTWDFGDGTPPERSTFARTTHSYARVGNYTARVTVEDRKGEPSSSTTGIVVVQRFVLTEQGTNAPAAAAVSNRSPVARLTAPEYAQVGEAVVLDASGSSDPNGDPLSYTWDFGDGTPPAKTTFARATHSYTRIGNYTARVTVDDEKGGTSSATAGIPIVQKIVLTETAGKVLFDFNKYNLKPEAIKQLAPVVQVIKDQPGVRILVVGHTDNIGSDAYNLKLAQARAEAVATYLVQNGVPRQSIQTEGRGKREPIASNATAEGRAQNSRVEITLDSSLR